jgi:hypothetical protein
MFLFHSGAEIAEHVHGLANDLGDFTVHLGVSEVG